MCAQRLLQLSGSVAGAADDGHGRVAVTVDFTQEGLGEALGAARMAHVQPDRTLGYAGLAPLVRATDVDQLELAGLRALIVDDNDTNRRILEAMLANWGLQSISADGGLAALALNSFLMSWTEYLFAIAFIISDRYKTLPVGMEHFLQQYFIDWGLLMSSSVIIAIPPILLFGLAGRWFIAGLTAGAVKG